MRTQSLYRALTSVADGRELPVLVLAVPASPLVLVGRGAELERGEIESCRARRVPILPWPGPGVRRLDRNRLVFQLIVAEETALAFGWPATEAGRDRVAELAARGCRRAGLDRARAEAGRVVAASGIVGTVEIGAIGDRAVVIGELVTAAAGRGGLRPAALAEGLLATFEEAMGAEFEPSLPTPTELEAIYLNDELLARDELGGLGRPALVASGST